MQNLMDVRPKLRQNIAFLLRDDGILFEGEDVSFRLKGKSASRWITHLGPYLDGEHTLDELCKDYEPALREMIVKLVDTLLQKGVLKDAQIEAPELLPAPVVRRFRPQLELLDHYVDTPRRRFKAFRESRALLTSCGQAFIALGRALLRNGLQTLFLAPSDRLELYLAAFAPEVEGLQKDGLEARLVEVDRRSLSEPGGMGGYDIVVYCAEESSLRDILDLHRRCVLEHTIFLAAYLFAGRAVIGPLVKPPGGPCWLCAQMRFSAHDTGPQSTALWQALMVGDGLSTRRPPVTFPLARMLGTGLAFEMFKMLAGAMTPETDGGVIIQDSETLESTYERLLRHPLCPLCSQSDSEARTHQLQELVAGRRDHQLARDDLLKQGSHLIAPHTGIFHEFRDDDLEQLPLRRTSLLVPPPLSPLGECLDVTAFSVENLHDARCAAFAEGVRRYCEALPDRRGMLESSPRELAEKGIRAVRAQRFSTWSGSQAFEHDMRVRWLPAYSHFSQDLCYVPAAVVYPRSALNDRGMFESVSPGSAVGTTFSETFRAGVLSALCFEQIRWVICGSGGVNKLDSARLEQASDPDLVFLLKGASRFECPFALLEVPSAHPLHVVLALTTEGAAQRAGGIGYGLSRYEAAKKALLDLTSDLQARSTSEKAPVLRSDIFPDLASFPGFTSETSDTGYFSEAMTSFEQIEDYLRERGYDILFVDTTTPDIREAGLLISGVVLLASSDDVEER